MRLIYQVTLCNLSVKVYETALHGDQKMFDIQAITNHQGTLTLLDADVKHDALLAIKTADDMLVHYSVDTEYPLPQE